MILFFDMRECFKTRPWESWKGAVTTFRLKYFRHETSNHGARIFFFLFRFDDSLCVFFSISGWWFQICFMLTRNLGVAWSNLTISHIFQMGWNQPPTRKDWVQATPGTPLKINGWNIMEVWATDHFAKWLEGDPPENELKHHVSPRKLTWNPENDGFFHRKISSFFGGPHFQVVHHVRLTGVYIPLKKHSLRGTFWSRSMIFETRKLRDPRWMRPTLVAPVVSPGVRSWVPGHSEWHFCFESSSLIRLDFQGKSE